MGFKVNSIPLCVIAISDILLNKIIFLGPSQYTIFGTPAPPISFVHDLDFNYFKQKNIYFVLFQGQDRLGQIPGRALQLGQATERWGQDRPSISTIFN